MYWRSYNLVMIAGQPRLLEAEYQELDDVARDEVPGPLTDALTTAFGGDVQVKYVIINFRNSQWTEPGNYVGCKIEIVK